MSQVKPGSATKAAGALYASAHVHAIRYGEKGSPEYRKAFNQHIGRFLSAVHSFRNKPSEAMQKAADEPRDKAGRWTRRLRQGADAVLNHEEGTPRHISYPAGAAGRAVQISTNFGGVPDEAAEMLGHHTRHIVRYALERALARVKKNL